MTKAKVELVTSLANIRENKLRLNFRKSKKLRNWHKNKRRNKKKAKRSL